MRYKAEKKLINQIIEFANWMVASELCLKNEFDPNPLIQIKKQKKEKLTLVNVLQHTTNVLSRFVAGVMTDPKMNIPEVLPIFTEETKIINGYISDLMKVRSPDMNLKLWIHEFSRTQGNVLQEMHDWQKKFLMKKELREDDEDYDPDEEDGEDNGGGADYRVR